jgi:TRAP-type C4-dicarboxylate transport system permease small subunit
MSADPDRGDPGDGTGRPAVSMAIEEALSAAALGLVALITFANVLARYFTDLSLAFTEEFSISLMVMMTLLGASVAVVRDRHMRITFLIARLSPRWRRRADLLAQGAIALMFLILVVWGAQFAYDDYRFEVTSPALGLPQWIYSVWLPVLSLAVALRAIGAAIRMVRR